MAAVARDAATETLSMILSPPLHLPLPHSLGGKEIRSAVPATSPFCTVRATKYASGAARSANSKMHMHGCACTTLVPTSRRNRTYLRL
jgi:hypothetical protein